MAIPTEFTRFRDLPKEIRLLIWEAALPGPRVVNVFQRPLKKTIGEWEDETGLSWPHVPLPEEGEDEEDQFGATFRRAITIRSEMLEALGLYQYSHDGYREGHLVGMTTKCPPPQILSVCKESYDVVKGQYTQAFNTLESRAGIWFNFTRDTLYLRHDNFRYYSPRIQFHSLYKILDPLDDFPLLDIENVNKVQKVAIYMNPQDYGFSIIDPLENALARLLGAFRGIETIAMVACHFTGLRGSQEHISLIEPIDVFEAISSYKNLLSDPSELQSRPQIPMLQTWSEDLDMEIVKEALCETLGNDMPLDWKSPRIERRVAVTDEILEKLNSARRSWEDLCVRGPSKE